jgi:quercetin dioxygenase-like cupin family protein
VQRTLPANEEIHDGHQAQRIAALGEGARRYFTGSVRVDAPFNGTGDARVGGATVTFEPGARTAWHTHPLGQTLLVLTGLGRVQREGGPIEEIRPGDIVWFPARREALARRRAGLRDVARRLAEKLDGSAVDWMEKVTDAQYCADKESK